MKKTLFIITLIICILTISTPVFSSNKVNIIINGKTVNFTEETGYPYVDENNRTMVPLRITMESAGAAVGYDSNKSTAIVITENNRIEVPIGINILYNNNDEIQNDTKSVIKNKRTYLPIRAVLEASGFTVEWDSKTNSVNAYSFNYDVDELVPYSTSTLETLVNNILKGNVVYINGNYYATPEYIKLINNVQVHYLGDDLNTAIYPMAKRNVSIKNEWITGFGKNDYDFGKLFVNKSKLDDSVKIFKTSSMENYVYIYAIYDRNEKIIYIVDEMTEEFVELQDGEGTFNGIRIKKEKGRFYLHYEDLKSLGLYEEYEYFKND